MATTRETGISTCLTLAAISAGLYPVLGLSIVLDAKTMPQVGPFKRGQFTAEQSINARRIVPPFKQKSKIYRANGGTVSTRNEHHFEAMQNSHLNESFT